MKHTLTDSGAHPSRHIRFLESFAVTKTATAIQIKLGARLRGSTATQRSKKDSEKVLGRVLGKGSQKRSEKGAFCGFYSKKRVLRRVLRRDFEKGVSRRCLERLGEYDPLGVCPIQFPGFFKATAMVSIIHCAAKGGTQKGIGHFFLFRPPLGNHSVSFLTFLVTFFAYPLLPPPFCGKVK